MLVVRYSARLMSALFYGGRKLEVATPRDRKALRVLRFDVLNMFLYTKIKKSGFDRKALCGVARSVFYIFLYISMIFVRFS